MRTALLLLAILYLRVPDAEGAQPCIGGVEIVTGATDPVSETDGLDVSTALATPEFPGGLLVMQDDRNEGFTRNFKLISWSAVLDALDL